jgi:hypothetical protein
LDKALIRQNKAAHRAMKYGSVSLPRDRVDAACVIHGSAYDWRYVERLYNMLDRNLNGRVQMHVYTEHDRSVPPHMTKHVLEEWPGISGPRKSWWYKMQMFNPAHHSGDLLYFDLDVIIVNDINWIVCEPTDFFWTIRDFRYLQRSNLQTMNSSLMWWNVSRFSWVWEKFSQLDINEVTRKYPGDQDYLHAAIDHTQRRFYPDGRAESWRWQAHDGGMDFTNRCSKIPGQGTVIKPTTSVLVFHGRPKPHQIEDPVIEQFWR